jgi:cell division transport system ATP-binding protein
MFHVYKRYGSATALNDINLEVVRNEFVFVTGPSGAGKTTLLRLLFLDEVVTGGQILVNGLNLQRLRRTKIPLLRRDMGVVFQDFRLINSYSVYDNIALVLETAGRHRRYIPKKVRQVLRMVGLEHRMDAHPPRLSGGEQQRVALARAAVGDPSILLADEPTGNLDEKCAEMVFDLLRQLHTRGTTIMVATHDQRLLEKVRARTVFLNAGRMEGHMAL